MEKILAQWYAAQNAATKVALKKVMEKKVFTLTVQDTKAFSFVEF